jgi:hypothetical protein
MKLSDEKNYDAYDLKLYSKMGFEKGLVVGATVSLIICYLWK